MLPQEADSGAFTVFPLLGRVAHPTMREARPGGQPRSPDRMGSDKLCV